MSEEELEILRYVDCSSSEIETVNKAVDTIKKIQQENKQLKERINKYENPKDMTLMYMWCDEKAKDKIKQLKERIQKATDYINIHWEDRSFDEIHDDMIDILQGKEDK